MKQSVDDFREVLQSNLSARWSSPRWLACITLEESARTSPTGSKVGIILRPAIASLVETSVTTGSIFLDLVPFLQTLRRKTQALENVFIEHGKLPSSKLPVLPVLVQGEPDVGPHAFSFSSANDFVEKEFEKLNSQLSQISRAKASKLLRESRDSLVDSMEDFRGRKEVHERRIVSAAASTILWLGDLGNKLNPIIQGIMNAVKVCCCREASNSRRLRMTMSFNVVQQRRLHSSSQPALNRVVTRCRTN
jgi:TATA-binding protein-associated factor